MSPGQAADDTPLIRPALDGLVPYEPGKPVEEVQRDLGLERVVKLASNEGPYGPFPAARRLIQARSESARPDDPLLPHVRRMLDELPPETPAR